MPISFIGNKFLKLITYKWHVWTNTMLCLRLLTSYLYFKKYGLTKL